MTWQPDYIREFKRRINIGRQLYEQPALQEEIKLHYSNNPIAWINDWCVTYDPRRVDYKIIPFILFPRQEEFIEFLWECLRDRESGLVEKCRDMGASWLCCAFAVWLWLFHPGTAIGFGSRKEEYVDEKGNLKAILPKIRLILENLPKWMLPRLVTINKDGAQLVQEYDAFKHAPYMKIINHVTNSNITGEAGDNIGRGGRTTLYIKDESAHYERPESVEAALGDNTDVQIDISSVNGSANVFYRRRMAGEEWHPGKKIAHGIVRIFIMDWRDHPLKDQVWYDARYQKAEREGLLHIFKQEVDRDYSSSIDRIIIPPEWVKAAIDAHIVLKFKAEGGKIGGQDVADGGRDKNALAMRHGVILKYAEDWGEGDAGDAAKRAVPACLQFGTTELYYDCIGVGSGFKNSINNMRDSGRFPQTLGVHPWDAGASVLEPDSNIVASDSQTPINKDFFANLKAQAWWSLRTRFYKTYKAIKENEKYSPSELISLDSKLPNIHKVVLELSQAQHKYSLDMKVMVDKKPEGASSPNLADAIVMCYFPIKELSILDVI